MVCTDTRFSLLIVRDMHSVVEVTAERCIGGSLTCTDALMMKSMETSAIRALTAAVVSICVVVKVILVWVRTDED